MPHPPFLITGSYMGSILSQPPSPLKRPRAASAPCENEEARLRKRSRGNHSSFFNEKILEDLEPDLTSNFSFSMYKGKGKQTASTSPECHAVLGSVTAAVIEELTQELKCGCCTELCYNPVIVNPCQHFFCGSCCMLWVRNGGTNCPACRGVSTSVTPSRVLQSMIDLLLRADSSKSRTENERAQADQIYRVGTVLRLPTPRPATPEPNLEPPNDNFARPCPTCLPGNVYGWRCPVPIQDPAIDPENAFDLDDGAPPGHAFCGNCDQLHNLQAPTSTKCDFCQVSFCGVGIQGRCCALGLLVQQPHAMSELPDLILSGAIYESFQGNSVEVDILVDYLRANEITLRAVYKEPNSFTPLIDSGIFDDLHAVSGGDDPDPTAARRRICRLCAAQLLIHGFKDWWIRERNRGGLPDDVVSRKDCLQGSVCDKQNDPGEDVAVSALEYMHCKEFNHIIANPSTVADPPLAPEAPIVPPSANNTNASAAQQLGLLFHQADVDMPPPSTPSPSPETDASPSVPMSMQERDAVDPAMNTGQDQGTGVPEASSADQSNVAPDNTDLINAELQYKETNAVESNHTQPSGSESSNVQPNDQSAGSAQLNSRGTNDAESILTMAHPTDPPSADTTIAGLNSNDNDTNTGPNETEPSAAILRPSNLSQRTRLPTLDDVAMSDSEAVEASEDLGRIPLLGQPPVRRSFHISDADAEEIAELLAASSRAQVTVPLS
ncbi:hypothetical protein K439DRAFT_1661584 [Ramaria rubella]|nr:hypothetical protein K439DRAFT_1661584 [Ramaria rubella]